jgi:FKBP-type peptidyl-prolyl cis-trans isomerase SlyD
MVASVLKEALSYKTGVLIAYIKGNPTMKAQIVSFHCTLKNRIGEVISSTLNQEVLTGIEGYSGMLAALIQGLNCIKEGEKRQIVVPADQAYGLYDPKLVIKISRKKLQLQHPVHTGHQIVIQDDSKKSRVFYVTKVFNKSLELDGNHPLAGQDLIFDIEATSARDATAQEIDEFQSSIHNSYLN